MYYYIFTKELMILTLIVLFAFYNHIRCLSITEDELVLSHTEIALFIRRWRSEEKICDPVFEIVMNTRSKNEMIKLVRKRSSTLIITDTTIVMLDC